MGGLYVIVALLHGLGWALYLYFAIHYPALVGVGLAAYLFGLRHAFDADHIAAIDDTVRYMVQAGKQPLSVGLFFSLGHSTVVIALALAIALAAAAVNRALPGLQSIGGVGYLIVTLLLLAWVVSFIVWRLGKFEAQQELPIGERG